MFNIQSISAMNSVNAVNAQFANNAYKNMDGKIFVSTDMFAVDKQKDVTVSSLLRRLENIDNLAKDRNGSQSVPFSEAKTSSERKEYQPQKNNTSETTGRLLNVYA